MPKILIDNNLSILLLKVLELRFPGSRHVCQLGMEEATDSTVHMVNTGTYITYLHFSPQSMASGCALAE